MNDARTPKAKVKRESLPAWAARQLGAADPDATQPVGLDLAERSQSASPARAKRPARPKPPKAIVTLAAGHLACLLCGQAVQMDDPGCPPIERLTTYGRERSPEAHPVEQAVLERATVRRGTDLDLEFTRCSSCRDLSALAERILDEHPAVQARIGSRSIGVERLELALAALAALDRADEAPRLTRTDADVLRLLRLLTVPGSLARWATRLVPFVRWTANLDTCAAAPWSHLDPEQDSRDELRGAYARLLRERVERPTPFACPTRGCLLCGVGKVIALPSRSAYAWQGVTYRGAERHACPSCAEAITYAGAVGPTAVDRAVFEFLEVPLGARIGYGVSSTAWADLAGAPRANSQPWQHLGDLDKLARELGVTS